MSAVAPETMPTVRRLQRLSSNCTAPAECSPAISIRAMSLRISTGRSKRASVSRSSGLNANEASPSDRPLRSSARTVPASAAPGEARSTFTLNAPTAFSAPVSARAPGMPPATIVSGRSSSSCARLLTKSAPLPRSTESDSQMSSTSRASARNCTIAGRASVRSTVCGAGLIRCNRTRAEPAVANETSRAPSDSGISATARWSLSARVMMSSAVRSRASQVAAAVQPSSIRIAIGPRVFVVASGGFHSGPAAATMMSAASASRISVSHQGVRAGVSSLGAISRRSRVAGKSTRRGRGGINRSSHHSTGSISRPRRTSGSAKPSDNPPIMPGPPVRPDAASGASYPP